MTCHYFEKDIALFVEGDLPSLRLAEVEAHLRGCETCREFADELRESQALLQGLRQDMVSSAALAGVRERVLGQLRSMDSSGVRTRLERWIYAGFRPRYALTSVVLGVMVSAGIWSAMRPVKPPDIVRAVVPPPVVDVPSTPAKVVPARAVRKTTKAQRHKEVDAQLKVIKLFTDDPNIVIYWLVDQKGADE